MINIGYSLVVGGAEVASWGGLPGRLEYRDSAGVLQLRLEAPAMGDYEGNDGRVYSFVTRVKVQPETRFHRPTGPETTTVIDGQVVVDPGFAAMSVDDARAEVHANLRQATGNQLSETDWLVVRGMEPGGKAATVAQITARQDIRDKGNSLGSDIDAMTTLADLEAWTYPQ